MKALVLLILATMLITSCGGSSDGSAASGNGAGNGSGGGGQTSADFTARTTDTYVGDTFEPNEVSVDAQGREVIRTLLVIMLAPGATEADVDGLLDDQNAVVTASVAGSRSMVIRIPDPGTLAALETVRAAIAAEPFVEAVYSDSVRKTRELPPNILSGSDSDYDYIAHQLAIGGHAAWNARAAIGNVPSVLLPDFFGAGDSQLTSFLDVNLLDSASAVGGDDHGYHVAGILAGSYGGSGSTSGLITGVIPDTINLNLLDLQQSISNANLDAWMLSTARAKTGTVVLSTSLGDDCTCADSNSWGVCQEPARVATQARVWIDQVRSAGLESKLLHLSAASNRDDGSSWAPACTDTTTTYGYRDAATSSSWNAAALMNDLVDASTSDPVAPLSNTLVVENLRINDVDHSQGRAEVLCVDENSFIGGTIAAVGTDVQSLTQSGTDAFSGTSMATPQVAGLAAYLLAIDSTLTPQKIIEVLDSTGVTPGTTGSPSCSDWTTPAKAIDAYAAVLALDTAASPGAAPVRLAILDVVGVGGVPGDGDGRFDEYDVAYLLAAIDAGTEQITAGDTTVRYSRTDLNGDGYDGGIGSDFSARFNLDIDYPPTYTEITGIVAGADKSFNENQVTDLDILCYYAYSDLYNGDEQKRDLALGLRCGDLCAAEVSVTGRREAAFIGPAFFAELPSGWTLGFSSHEWNNGWDPEDDGVIDRAYTGGFGAFAGPLPEAGTEFQIPNTFGAAIVKSLTLTDFWQFGTIEECVGCGGVIRVTELSEDGNTLFGEVDFIGSDADDANPGVSRVRATFRAARDYLSDPDSPYEQCSAQWWLIDPT